jgi:hypothetical protein
MANLQSITITDPGNITLPSGTTAQRPASPVAGMTRFNTDFNQAEVYSAGRNRWLNLITGNLTADAGTSAATAARSAAEILEANPSAVDGVYWIDLPTVGATQIYCAMSRSFGQEGGYMLAMKATRGTTFSYSANYWTSTNTLNPSTQLNRTDADAKFHVFNYYNANNFLAFFPDLNNGGMTSGGGSGWHWLITGQSTTCLSRFQTETTLSNNPNGENMFVGSGFSNQAGFQRWAINYNGNASARVRWGFGWNNETDQASNDVSGGIGMDSSYGSFSAGDRINCCQIVTGVNRSARFELWVR